MMSVSPLHDSVDALSLDELYQALQHEDGIWLAHTLKERWKKIRSRRKDCHTFESGDDSNSGALAQDVVQTPDSFSERVPVWPRDLTLSQLPEGYEPSEYVKFIRSYDWAATGFGPMSSWCTDFRRLVNLVLTDPRPATFWWGTGDERRSFYNEGYMPVLGMKHPWALGKTFAVVWPEVRETIGAIFESVEQTSVASRADDAYFKIDRRGYAEEFWVSFSVLPIPGRENKIIGLYNAIHETTKQMLTSRRMHTLLKLGQSTSTATSTVDFWQRIVEGIDFNEFEVPFAACYSLVGDGPSPHTKAASEVGSSSDRSSSRAKLWKMEGSIGISLQDGLPSGMDSDRAAELLTPTFAATVTAGKVSLLRFSDGTLCPGLRPIAKCRASGDGCELAVLLPISPTHPENPLGFILIGINPHAQYDEDYEHFTQLLMRQLGTSLASVVLFEEQLQRSRVAAALAAQEKVTLSSQLAETKLEAFENETQFRRMADLAPVSIFHFDSAGNVLYANRNFYELMDFPRHRGLPFSWYDFVQSDDCIAVEREWARLALGQISFEVKLKKPYFGHEEFHGESIEGDTWIIASAYAVHDRDGSVKEIHGCLTDISRQKWMEGFQTRQTKDAQERQRQQERFMDSTSHECRNPLSAITLCTESIVESCHQLLDLDNEPFAVTRATVESYLEGAETVMACVEHMRRILDDVLTLSKVDSGMLSIAPVEVQPEKILSKSLRIFETGLVRADIAMESVVGESYQALGIDWVLLDSVRFMQMLINLITNAMKFTQTEDERRITVTLDARQERPMHSGQHIRYMMKPEEQATPSSDPDDVFVSVSVKDTGRGIAEDEIDKLFGRFQQASPKTHVNYGGSGLGLYVCRELAQLQGGDIGLASEGGKGSTFEFYIPVKRCQAPLNGKREASNGENTRRSSTPQRDIKQAKSQKPPSTANCHVSKSSSSLEQSVTPQSILLVEDNIVNQKVMAKQLERAGHSVAVANHGIEALDYIRQSRFCLEDGCPLDIILLDVEMPVMDGLTCIRHIREMQQSGEIRHHIRVIAVTANARSEQQTMALEAGVDVVVTKPFGINVLLDEVQALQKPDS